jgi:hypothetical protein
LISYSNLPSAINSVMSPMRKQLVRS